MKEFVYEEDYCSASANCSASDDPMKYLLHDTAADVPLAPRLMISSLQTTGDDECLDTDYFSLLSAPVDDVWFSVFLLWMTGYNWVHTNRNW